MAELATIVEQLSKLTVVETAELVKKLEEAWGVTAAAPVAVAAAVRIAALAALLVAALLVGAGIGCLAVAVAHAAGTACLFRGELVGRALFVGSLAAFAGNGALALRVHGSETAVTGAALLIAFVVA